MEPVPSGRWAGKDPLEVIETLEARLAERNATIQRLNGDQPTSDKPKRRRRNDERHGDRRLLEKLEEFFRYEQTDISPEESNSFGDIAAYGDDLAKQIAAGWKMIHDHLNPDENYMTADQWRTALSDEGLISVKPTSPDFLNAVSLVQRGLAEILPNCTHDPEYVDILARTAIDEAPDAETTDNERRHYKRAAPLPTGEDD